MAVHSILLMIWVMPDNPLRATVGPDRLRSYINPYFEQSWSIFAPLPLRGGENVLIRAYVGNRKAGTGKATDWYDITAKEDERIKYLLNPSRIHSATRRLGSDMNSLLPDLNKDQRLLVQGDYLGLPQTDPGNMDLGKDLLKANTDGSAAPETIAAYLRTDQMLTRFATLYATARWGEGVTELQFRVGHRLVPNYDVRNDVNFLDVAFTYSRFGWREAMPANGDAQAAFDGYVGKR
ncbi:MAG: hypothetical protein H7288_04880 [Kineosporiaceae bacterium]|nr:hypothetical protein [Aeromicrobium sp.]